MPYFLVRQKVEDYAKWKQVFDEHAAVRATVGSKGGYVYRNSGDPNEVFVLLEVTDLQKGREFAKSEDLRKTMQRAGVTDKPDLYFLGEAERTSA
jgi:hypothetical protein